MDSKTPFCDRLKTKKDHLRSFFIRHITYGGRPDVCHPDDFRMVCLPVFYHDSAAFRLPYGWGQVCALHGAAAVLVCACVRVSAAVPVCACERVAAAGAAEPDGQQLFLPAAEAVVVPDDDNDVFHNRSGARPSLRPQAMGSIKF